MSDAFGSPRRGSPGPSGSDVPAFTWGSEPAARPDAPYQWSTAVDASRTDRLAVASLLCSVAGFVTGLTALLGIVFGLVARYRIKRSRGASKGLRLALSGVLVGILALAWTVVVVEVALRAADDAPLNLAQSEVLPGSAYPHGWTGQGQELENDYANYFSYYMPPEAVRLVAVCLHMSAAHVQTDPVEAASQQYGSPTKPISATDTVDVFSSTAAAAADAVASGRRNAVTCQMQDWSGNFRYADDTATNLTSLERKIPPLGDHDSDIEVRDPDPHSGDVFFDDYITVQQGSSESNLVVSTDGAPPPAGLVDRLATAAAWRLGHH